MSKNIDCFFIGHNEMKFSEYENKIRKMGINSGAYRDLNLNFVQYKENIYTAAEVFNKFYSDINKNDETFKEFTLGDTFSLTIAYLGTYLNKRGLSIDYVNSFQNEKETLAKKLTNNKILSIVIPTTLYVSMFPIIEIVSFVRQYNKTAKIIIGGPFIATQMKTQEDSIIQYLFNTINADFYINNSQGEETLYKLIHALRNDVSYKDIDNISYRNGDKYISNPWKAENNSLAENIVDWTNFEDKIDESIAVRTSISCPFSCSFCGFPQHAGKYQLTSIDAIEKELNCIDSLGKVKSINFIDDTFNVPPERFKELLRLMIKNKYKFKWNSHYRCQFADRETVELMKESGCEGVFLGIESGSEQILKNMNKAATIENYKKGIALLKEYDIITHASFIIGFPGETEETVQETINFIEETQPIFFRTQLWYCDPFTPIWNQREQYGIKGSQFEWKHKTMDAHIACDLIEEIFLSVKNSTWLPQNNFEFEGVFQLLRRGMSLEQIKTFVEGFNQGVKDKLIDNKNQELSFMAIEKIKESFYKDNKLYDLKSNIGIKDYVDDFDMEASFEF